ncbi:hypothetical protein ILUMI_02757 [Ignelater luminosus]|uniref:Uncharacterized protein n=1 Tax=Ignelater luminosus TaxID=2038154 RepID=A0A8K0DFX0_IGNLU|nr:hypothetical protein ILUMI_02757 [Ignelater luminosus]
MLTVGAKWNSASFIYVSAVACDGSEPEEESNQQKWSKQVMQAESFFKESSCSSRCTPDNIGKTCEKQRQNPALQMTKNLGRYKGVYSEDKENEQVNYLINMEPHLFGLTSKEIRCLAFQLANRNGQDHLFNKEERLAGHDSFFDFQKRQKPRLQFVRWDLTSFLISWKKIFNVDETGIIVNLRTNSCVLTFKGRWQVGVLTSGDRAQTVTAEICC